MVSLLGLDPATYRPHPLHDARARPIAETNCYTDILIELLHARGDEPLAALGFTVRIDFEGDQWTFFKPPPEDLERLFGIDIHEMQPYRRCREQIAEQLAARTDDDRRARLLVPARHAVDRYRREHVKSSAVIEAIDVDGERLRYFHNAGLYELGGEDFRGVLRLDRPPDDVLPPYTELVRFDAGPRLGGEQLRDAALAIFREHLAYVPPTNPFTRFGESLADNLPDLLEGDNADYHAYAFATVRMAGAAFELAPRTSTGSSGTERSPRRAALSRIVGGSKVLSFKLARRRPFDAEPACAKLAADWDEAMSGVAALSR